MEYLLLICEFFYVKGWKSLFYILIPVIIAVLIYFFASDCNYIANASNFHTNIITVVGILVGFTISTFTMLLTVNHANIDKSKNLPIGKKLFKKDLSLYDSVIIGLAYTILIQCVLLLANFIYPIFVDIESLKGKALFSINIAIVSHIILILMRNVLDFYFIVLKKN